MPARAACHRTNTHARGESVKGGITLTARSDDGDLDEADGVIAALAAVPHGNHFIQVTAP